MDRHDESEAGDLNSRFAACLRELSLVSMYLDRNLREKITRQLRNLFNVDEWDEDDVPVNVGSFRSFVRALILIEPLQRPMLALNQQGGVIAMWGENDSRFVLDFFPRDRLRWFAVSPNEDENVADKSVGETSIEKLGGIIDAFGARGLIDGAG